jgi:hypothetical protein
LCVRSRTQLSVLQIVTWAALGLTGGVVLGFALAEWTGNLTAPRVRRAARRIREPAPPSALTAAGAARAVADALGRDDIELPLTAPRVWELIREAV